MSVLKMEQITIFSYLSVNRAPLPRFPQPVYGTSRLLGKEGKPGWNELTRKSMEDLTSWRL